MYAEDDLLALSGLQHLEFCERQWALIHLEQQWAENRLTAEGSALHERVHKPEPESRPGVRIVRSLAVQSLRLGLTGVCDVVEFPRPAAEDPFDFLGPPGAVEAVAAAPYPVEYKRGKPKPDDCDLVQLCAQALCLEEMIGVEVPEGALFYWQTRHRLKVEFDAALRGRVEELAGRMHALARGGVTPPPEFGKKCKACSLEAFCLPAALGDARRASRYLARQMRAAREEDSDCGTC